MKISKLFHWLYAVLMLLPVFSIGVTCAYAIFNKNAFESYEHSNTKDYVDVINIPLEDVYFTFSNEVNYVNTNRKQLTFDNVEYISGNLTTAQKTSLLNVTRIQFWRDTSLNNNYITWTDLGTNLGGSNTQFTIKLNLTAVNSEVYSSGLQDSLVYRNNVNKTLDNVFYYSIDKVQQSPLFNWAYDSFLATPITYITGLFGMANDHVAVMFMSYWLAISVIWLVFDMVMYVPLLVHRWIDKGVLE